MRMDTFPADGEFRGSDPELAFRQLIMEAGSDIAILEPGRATRRAPRGHSGARDSASNHWQANHWLDPTTTGTSAGAARSAWPSTPGGGGPRDRALGRAPVHGADPDQGRAPPGLG